MNKLKNAIDIFKLLQKTNCKKCNEKTCLAFAVAVYKKKKKLRDCPFIDKEILKKYQDKIDDPRTYEEDIFNIKNDLLNKLKSLDLSSIAEKIGGKFFNNKLTLKICGKDFSIDQNRKFSSDIHIHHWIVLPLLDYIIEGSGDKIVGKWIPFRELKDGRERNSLYVSKCEMPLKKIADTYTDLFEDMIHLFDGKQIEKHFDADISLVLHPLPKVPILICYWKPEDNLESSLNIFYDVSSEKNIHIEYLYTLVTGLVRMFEKISLRHGY